MSPMCGSNQRQSRIRSECSMMVNLERNKRIVLCMNHERRYADSIQEMNCRLRRIVIGRCPKAKQRSRETIVKLPDRFHFLQTFAVV